MRVSDLVFLTLSAGLIWALSSCDSGSKPTILPEVRLQLEVEPGAEGTLVAVATVTNVGQVPVWFSALRTRRGIPWP